MEKRKKVWAMGGPDPLAVLACVLLTVQKVENRKKVWALEGVQTASPSWLVSYLLPKKGKRKGGGWTTKARSLKRAFSTFFGGRVYEYDHFACVGFQSRAPGTFFCVRVGWPTRAGDPKSSLNCLSDWWVMGWQRKRAP